MAKEKNALYTTAEIMLATGLGRGTITNRAKRMGIDRTGMGYTVEQIVAMITYPLQMHRKSEQAAEELRGILNERLENENIPMAIVSRKNGAWELEYSGKE